MLEFTTKHIAKYRLKSNPNYIYSTDKICFNTKTGRVIKQILKGSTSPMRGRNHSEETRLKISHRNKKSWENRSYLLKEYDSFIQENLGKITQKEMAEIIGCSPSAISHHLRKIKK